MKRSLLISWIIVIALLGENVYLFYSLSSDSKVVDSQLKELQGISHGLDNYSKQLHIYQDKAIKAKKYYENECKELKKKEI